MQAIWAIFKPIYTRALLFGQILPKFTLAQTGRRVST
jgi:hypothetical protein